MLDYTNMMQGQSISIIYSGPMWADGIKGIAEMVRTRLEVDDILGSAANSIFSVFVEQVTNVSMYSADKDRFSRDDAEPLYISKGTLVLGHRNKTYFIQTGNAVKNESVEFLKGRIDHLNTLDKNELRQLHRRKLNEENENPESKGAGLGLIEIARRATAPIEYRFEPINEKTSYFTMYVEVS
jgi:hypothetical protein